MRHVGGTQGGQVAQEAHPNEERDPRERERSGDPDDALRAPAHRREAEGRRDRDRIEGDVEPGGRYVAVPGAAAGRDRGLGHQEEGQEAGESQICQTYRRGDSRGRADQAEGSQTELCRGDEPDSAWSNTQTGRAQSPNQLTGPTELGSARPCQDECGCEERDHEPFG